MEIERLETHVGKWMSLVRKHGKQGLFAGLTHLCFYRHGKTRERTVVGKSDETL